MTNIEQQIEIIKTLIAKMTLLVTLLSSTLTPVLGGVGMPSLGGSMMTLDDIPIAEPQRSLEAQRVDTAGWYIKFTSGEELFVPNEVFRTIKAIEKTDNKTEDAVRAKLKNKFIGNRISWDKVFFTFDKFGNIENVEWIH